MAAETQPHTVLESSLAVLRAHGLTTIFGNPGSNELPFLAGLPADFSYVLGLHEGAVVGMADGFAQASGRPVLVSLHAASGSGNGMGALTNARYAHSPLVLLAGQQMRRTVGQEVMLASVDAGMLPRPLVKWSHEPLAPHDVPRALSQAAFEATSEPRGPVYLSVPMDDWAEAALPDDVHLPRRQVLQPLGLPASTLDELCQRIAAWKRPVLVVGPDVDAARAQPAAVALAEHLGAPVWIAPSASRCPFPTTHAHYRGVLPPGIRSVRERLDGHDGVLVIGAPVFRYHRWEPDAYVSPGTELVQITSDAGEAARAPFGDAVVAAVGPALQQLAARAWPARPPLTPRAVPAAQVGQHMSGEQLLDVLNKHRTPDVTYVNETTTLDITFLERIHIDAADGYHFPASGGLGFGLPAAVGIALARPSATVVAVVGDGSANYGLTALWTAAQHRTRTVFIIANNGAYGALRGFAARLQAENSPGLFIPGIDFVALGQGYGVPASRTRTVAEFEAAYVAALSADGPVLIDAKMD